MALVIVESPNKIPKIKKVLGSGYVVMASVGHIMDLEKKDMGINLETWEPTYEVSKDKKDVVKKIQEEAKNHSEIYIATDADREGAGIASNLLEILPKKGKKLYRVIFKEINEKEILSGLKNPIGFQPELVDAQQARRMTDRMVGFKVSPVLWSKGLKGTSAGRVQSAALSLLSEREKEIKAFKTEEYWSIDVLAANGLEASLEKIDDKKVEIANKQEADHIQANIIGPLIVTKYDAKSKSKKPFPPFITSTLQKEAGTKFNWTGQRVMDTAQKLFSQGLITYHRTDSTRCDPEKITKVREAIESKYGKKYLPAVAIEYGPKESAQDAHEAIRPTFEPMPMGMSSDEKKLQDLIEKRFEASQMADAIFDQTSIELETKKGKTIFQYKASGSVLQFDGYIKAYGGNSQDKVLPSMKKNDALDIKKISPEQHFTKAPSRFNDASFTDKMEKEGIGRPSTYASIPETLIKRGYVERDGKTLYATEIGIVVSDYLIENFDSITSIKFTADMELELDDIAAGKKKLKDVMDKFHKELKDDLEKAMVSKDTSAFKTDEVCPDCKKKGIDVTLIKKIGKFGLFLACQDKETCGYTVSFGKDGKAVVAHEELTKPCPKCSSGNVTIKKGKFGSFASCSSYPTCNWTGKVDSEGNVTEKTASSAETTDQKCHECSTGFMVKRSSKFGSFLGCNKYPACKATIKLDSAGKPAEAQVAKKAPKLTGEKCPQCKSDMIERTGKFGLFECCSGFPKCKYIKK